jgi:hypothetical protein
MLANKSPFGPVWEILGELLAEIVGGLIEAAVHLIFSLLG